MAVQNCTAVENIMFYHKIPSSDATNMAGNSSGVYPLLVPQNRLQNVPTVPKMSLWSLAWQLSRSTAKSFQFTIKSHIYSLRAQSDGTVYAVRRDFSSCFLWPGSVLHAANFNLHKINCFTIRIHPSIFISRSMLLINAASQAEMSLHQKNQIIL